MIEKLLHKIKTLELCDDEYLEYQNKRMKPDWEIWEHAPRARLIDVVALSFDICPNCVDIFEFDIQTNVEPSSFFHAVSIELTRRLAIVEANYQTIDFDGELSTKHPRFREISTHKFYDWSKLKSWDLPERFPHTSNDQIIDNEAKYPWGTHNTYLLTKLSEVAIRFWARYDPSDPTTAPTNKQVSDWLIEQKVSERNATVIATILRADGLPMGKRK